MFLLDGKYSPCHGRPIGISEWLIEVQVIQADIIWHVPKEGKAEEHHISLLYPPGVKVTWMKLIVWFPILQWATSTPGIEVAGFSKKYSTQKESDFKNQFKQIGSYNHSLLEWNIFQRFPQPLSQAWTWLINIKSTETAGSTMTFPLCLSMNQIQIKIWLTIFVHPKTPGNMWSWPHNP